MKRDWTPEEFAKAQKSWYLDRTSVPYAARAKKRKEAKERVERVKKPLPKGWEKYRQDFIKKKKAK